MKHENRVGMRALEGGMFVGTTLTRALTAAAHDGAHYIAASVVMISWRDNVGFPCGIFLHGYLREREHKRELTGRVKTARPA